MTSRAVFAPRGGCILSWATASLSLLLTLTSAAACPADLGEELRVNTVTEEIQQSSSVASDADGGFVVAWQSEVAQSGDEIRARRFDPSGLASSDEIAVNAVTRGHQNAPAIALDAQGNFVVAWQSLIASDLQIRARRFDSRGAALGDEFAVSTTGDAHSAPAIAMAEGGDFVVVWETAFNGSYEIRARRYDSRGVAQGGQLAVNTETASSQRSPAVAMAEGGDFVVVWRSNVAGSFEIRGQLFTALGVKKGDEIAINTVTAGDQLAPAVAMGERGDFVVAWESSFAGGYEIRARRFTALGVAKDGELAVHPATAREQFAPALAMGHGGAFVVAWHTLVRDPAAAGYEIRARAFAANGVARGGELAINALTAGTQKAAAVAMGKGGSFVVTWHSDATGGWEISARRGRLCRARRAGRGTL